MLSHTYDELHPSEIPLHLDSPDVTRVLADFYDDEAFGEDSVGIFSTEAGAVDVDETGPDEMAATVSHA